MSKLSFRARQLDAYKAMPIYRSEEIPEVTDVAAINRAVPQMPTGMEKDEETEHHLQRALSAQQVYGTSEALVIPIPDIDDAKRYYEQIYATDYKPPRQYIHAQSLGVDQEIPDYDIDSEDEAWLENQTKKMEITPKIFEEMIDRLEKGSGQQVVELKDAKVLLKEDDDLIITVYDYWLNKRLKCTPHSLIPTVKCEKRDGSTTNNPYVAFRRRTEKMQTRKNRKNDEVSYEKMLKLRRDLQRAVTVLEMIKKREKCKKELLQLTIDILDKRYDMEDYTGSHLTYAESQKVPRSALYPLYQDQISKDSEVSSRKLKRKYEKKKHKSGTSQYQNEVDVMDYGSTEDEPLSPGMLSDQEEEANPDGPFAFRRKKYCNYHAPLESSGNWEWSSLRSGGHASKSYRYSLTSVSTGPESRRCLGYTRRRLGRGGRVIFDRAYTEQRADFWDRVLDATVPTTALSVNDVKSRLDWPDSSLPVEEKPSSSTEPTFHNYSTENKWLHFHPSEEYDSTAALFNGTLLDMSSDDVNDNIDPIVNILPEPVPSSSSLGFVPISAASNTASTSEQLLRTIPSSEPTLPSPIDCDSSSEHITPTLTPSSIKSTVIERDYESHHKQLQTLKKDQHISNSTSKVTCTATNTNHTDITISRTQVTEPDHIVISSSNSSSDTNTILESTKATYAVTALPQNATAAVLRGNGIKHLNGPTSKVDLKRAEINSTGSVTVSSIRKLNYPLTPSSDTSDPSIVSDLITSIPGEGGDNLVSRTRLPSDTDFTTSAGLNNIADVGSTMEVT